MEYQDKLRKITQIGHLIGIMNATLNLKGDSVRWSLGGFMLYAAPEDTEDKEKMNWLIADAPTIEESVEKFFEMATKGRPWIWSRIVDCGVWQWNGENFIQIRPPHPDSD